MLRQLPAMPVQDAPPQDAPPQDAFLLDAPLFDYRTHRLGRLGQRFRGPPPDPVRPYLAFLGGTQTFGRYCERPFAALAGDALGIPAVNLGAIGAGPGFFLGDEGVLRIAADARLRVVEVMGAEALTNCLYSVTPRRNGKLHGPTDLLRGVFPEVDFDRFAQVGRMLRHLALLDPGRFRLVEIEIRNAWIGRMQTLLARLDGPTVLLWFSTRAPDDAQPDPEEPWQMQVPHFVTAAMVEAVSPSATRYVECVSREGLPQDLTRDGRAVLFRPTGEPVQANRSQASPAMHAAAAAALIPVLARLLDGAA